MVSISSNEKSFKQLDFTLSVLPVIPYLKLEGFAPEGVEFPDVEIATSTIGADGLVAFNAKPTLYPFTFHLMPNSNSRNILDLSLNAFIPVFGKELVGHSVTLTAINNLTGCSRVYTGGRFTNIQSGDSATLDDGQQAKTYTINFPTQVVLPL